MNPDRLCMGCMEERGDDPTCPDCGWLDGTPAGSALYLPPRTVLKDQYLIGRVLDYGGFGILYLGWDLLLARKLAVKEYMPNGVASRASGEMNVTVFSGSPTEFEYGLKQFLKEGRVLARLQGHPNIVDVLNFFRANDTAYLVMEFLDGTSLERHLEQEGGKLPFEAAAALLSPAMDALTSVHREGLLHRDVSPDNVFVLRNGMVKLIDFGAARYALGQRSRNLSVILKEGYAPTEQYTSAGKQGPWTDVYGMAATLYHCLTGVVPPPSLERLETDTLQPPSQKGSDIDAAAEEGLLKALAVRAGDRLQSIEDLHSALGLGHARSRPVPPAPQPESDDWKVLLRRSLTGLWRQARTSARGLAASPVWRRLGGMLRALPGKGAVVLGKISGKFASDAGSPEKVWLFRTGAVAVAAILLALALRPSPSPEDPEGGQGKEKQRQGVVTDDERGGSDNSSRNASLTRPAISALNPEVVTAGRGDLDLTLEGRDFRKDSAVLWNDQLRLPTKYLDAGRLRARVTAEKLSRPGKAVIKVLNPNDSPDKAAVSAPAELNIKSPATNADARYEELIEQAVAASRSGNPRTALERAREAVQLDPNRHQAYDVIGYVSLYSFGDVGQAEKNYRAALARGGQASFFLHHDHSALSFEQRCSGFFRVLSDQVSFESNAGDSFRVSRSGGVKEAKMNRSGRFFNPMSRTLNHFHIKTSSRNYNFLGTSRIAKEEAELLLRLINSRAVRR